MLSLADLKKLRSRRVYPVEGTKLVLTEDLPGSSMKAGDILEFLSFNSFRSATGQHKLSWERGFGAVGSAHSWSDFTKRGRQWITQNYDPEKCELIVIRWGNDVIGMNASRVRLA